MCRQRRNMTALVTTSWGIISDDTTIFPDSAPSSPKMILMAKSEICAIHIWTYRREAATRPNKRR
jgi:hypothetical protein